MQPKKVKKRSVNKINLIFMHGNNGFYNRFENFTFWLTKRVYSSNEINFLYDFFLGAPVT